MADNLEIRKLKAEIAGSVAGGLLSRLNAEGLRAGQDNVDEVDQQTIITDSIDLADSILVQLDLK